MSDPVRAQYEAYPYPARDPADEAKRLITGSPSRLIEIDHYLFGGHRDWSRPFRALVAGGGTGDATVMLAQELADVGAGAAEVVYLDLSASARATAEARVAARGLEGVRFVTGSLLDLPQLGLGRFDYIDCCGVLHHLADPAAGLRALCAVLEEDGGLGIMVYGAYGRTGVYPLQAALRQLGGDLPLAERIAQARRLLDGLPQSNWFRRNPFLGDHRRGDAELVDLLLHAQDRAYTVPELAELVGAAGLHLVSLIEPTRYEPACYLKDPNLARRAAALPPLERAALAERLAGNIKTHIAYLSRLPDSAARVEGPQAVPCLVDLEGEAVARAISRDLVLKVSSEGVTLHLPLPRLAPALLPLIDGSRSLGEIHAALQVRHPDLAWEAFLSEFERLREVLGGLNKLLLRYPSP